MKKIIALFVIFSFAIITVGCGRKTPIKFNHGQMMKQINQDKNADKGNGKGKKEKR